MAQDLLSASPASRPIRWMLSKVRSLRIGDAFLGQATHRPPVGPSFVARAPNRPSRSAREVENSTITSAPFVALAETVAPAGTDVNSKPLAGRTREMRIRSLMPSFLHH